MFNEIATGIREWTTNQRSSMVEESVITIDVLLSVRDKTVWELKQRAVVS
jgi:hypothetical protein